MFQTTNWHLRLADGILMPSLRKYSSLAASKMKFIIICNIVIWTTQICGCTSRTKDYTSNRLIEWKSEHIMNDGIEANSYYTNHKKFIKPYFKTIYKKDTLIVSTLIEINSCGETVGEIDFSNDTLYLLTKLISNEACASVVFHKFTYVIQNLENEKYFIVSKK